MSRRPDAPAGLLACMPPRFSAMTLSKTSCAHVVGSVVYLPDLVQLFDTSEQHATNGDVIGGAESIEAGSG